MNPANQMQTIITQIADQHQFDLTAAYGHLELEPVYNQPLVIEKHGKETVAVLHVTSDGLALDPMIRFHMTAIGQWLPIAEHLSLFGRTRVLAHPTYDTPGEWNVMPKAQRDCATFANVWARNIKEQGWLKQPAKSKGYVLQPDTAWLIAPDDTITEIAPVNPDEGFRLRELYNHLDCDTVEVISLDHPDYILLGDENGKYGEYEINAIATRFSRIDEHRDEFAGRAILCPTTWFK